mmetsp:Transcript_10941/g.23173  ORF Transcript_10941/g.23173 Transcript_10941/m.23173 type:complete len:537 (-) Transcript_10941:257-1867(-)
MFDNKHCRGNPGRVFRVKKKKKKSSGVCLLSDYSKKLQQLHRNAGPHRERHDLYLVSAPSLHHRFGSDRDRRVPGTADIVLEKSPPVPALDQWNVRRHRNPGFPERIDLHRRLFPPGPIADCYHHLSHLLVGLEDRQVRDVAIVVVCRKAEAKGNGLAPGLVGGDPSVAIEPVLQELEAFRGRGREQFVVLREHRIGVVYPYKIGLGIEDQGIANHPSHPRNDIPPFQEWGYFVLLSVLSASSCGSRRCFCVCVGGGRRFECLFFETQIAAGFGNRIDDQIGGDLVADPARVYLVVGQEGNVAGSPAGRRVGAIGQRPVLRPALKIAHGLATVALKDRVGDDVVQDTGVAAVGVREDRLVVGHRVVVLPQGLQEAEVVRPQRLLVADDGYLVVLRGSRVEDRARLAGDDRRSHFQEDHGRVRMAAEELEQHRLGAKGKVLESLEEGVHLVIELEDVVLALVIVDGKLQNKEIDVGRKIREELVGAFGHGTNIGPVGALVDHQVAAIAAVVVVVVALRDALREKVLRQRKFFVEPRL